MSLLKHDEPEFIDCFIHSILIRIQSYSSKFPPNTVQENLGPILQKLTTDPTFKLALRTEEAPVTNQLFPSHTEDLQKIHNSLSTLSKAVANLQSKVTCIPPLQSDKQDIPNTAHTARTKGTPNPTTTHSAIASYRTPTLVSLSTCAPSNSLTASAPI